MVLLNADVEILSGSMDMALSVLRGCGSLAAVGFHLMDVWGRWDHGWEELPTARSRVCPWRLDRWWERFRAKGAMATDLPRKAGWVGGGAMVVRRKAWMDVGPMDEEYHMYAEETDWCWRAAKRGWTVMGVPRAGAIHLGGKSASQRPGAMYAALYSSKLRVLRKHRSGSERWFRRLSIPQWIWTCMKGCCSKNRATRLKGRAAWGLLMGRDGMKLIRAVEEEMRAPVDTPQDPFFRQSPWTVFLRERKGPSAGRAFASLSRSREKPSMEVISIPESEEMGSIDEVVSRTAGEWILFLDSSMEPHENSILSLSFFASQHPDVGAMIPQVVDGNGFPARPMGVCSGWMELTDRLSLLETSWFRIRRRMGLLPWYDPVFMKKFHDPWCFAARRKALEGLGSLRGFEGKNGLKEAVSRLSCLGWKVIWLPWIVVREGVPR